MWELCQPTLHFLSVASSSYRFLPTALLPAWLIEEAGSQHICRERWFCGARAPSFQYWAFEDNILSLISEARLIR